MPFAPGTVLAGKYRVEKLLGEGGMGWVVVATHLHLEQRVALKFMHAKNVAEHPDAVARFLREARAAARIQSEHVARVSDVGTLEGGEPYLVMEYLEGQDLEGLLRGRGKLPPAEVVDLAIQACEGLAEAHAKGIVHRDLKPANLFLARRTDGSPRVKLLDFGISKMSSSSTGGATSQSGSMTSTQALMGSPLYMSPEQLRSSKNVDRRADLWSMGVILYEMLSGSSPFEAETLPEVCARIMAEPPPAFTATMPRGLDAVVMRCLEKDPQNRFADAGALAAALAPYGPPESRAVAERIARVVRSSGASLPDIRTDASGPNAALTTSAASGIAQTNASFGTVSSTVPKRALPTMPLAIAGGAALVLAVLVGVLATRGKHDDATAASATGAPPPAVASVLPSATAMAPPAAPPPVPGPPPTSDSATAAAAPSPPPAAPPPPAPARNGSGGHPRPATSTAAAPPAPPAPAPAPAPAKPASTNGFGGRD